MTNTVTENAGYSESIIKYGTRILAGAALMKLVYEILDKDFSIRMTDEDIGVQQRMERDSSAVLHGSRTLVLLLGVREILLEGQDAFIKDFFHQYKGSGIRLLIHAFEKLQNPEWESDPEESILDLLQTFARCGGTRFRFENYDREATTERERYVSLYNRLQAIIAEERESNPDVTDTHAGLKLLVEEANWDGLFEEALFRINKILNKILKPIM